MQSSPDSSPRRGYMDCMFDVLRALYEGHMKPTRVMYASNLSWSSLMKIMKTLEASGLVVKGKVHQCEIQSRKWYALTPKGIETYQTWEECRRVIVNQDRKEVVLTA